LADEGADNEGMNTVEEGEDAGCGRGKVDESAIEREEERAERGDGERGETTAQIEAEAEAEAEGDMGIASDRAIGGAVAVDWSIRVEWRTGEDEE
jgi:hypothetical protein